MLAPDRRYRGSPVVAVSIPLQNPARTSCLASSESGSPKRAAAFFTNQTSIDCGIRGRPARILETVSGVDVTSRSSTIGLAKLGGAHILIDGDGASEVRSSDVLSGMR